MDILPFLVSGWVFLIGLYGVVTSRNLVHAVICLTVVQSSTYVLLLAVGFVAHATAPIYADQAAGTLTPLAYVYYGHPSLRLTR